MSLSPQQNKKMLEDLILLSKKHLTKVDEALITKAFDFAAMAHENDIRASDEPYFSHPYAVAKILCDEVPFDDVSVACGLMHDIVEDHEDYSIDVIKKNFGEEISIIIDGLTKIKYIFKGSDISQAENYRKLLMSISRDIRVIIVKFADRLHNMRTIEFLNPDKKKRIAKETLEIYAPLAHRFGLGNLKWELEDLAFKELNKQAYEDIKKKISSKRGEREKYIEKFSAPIIERLNEYGFKFEINGRPKHLYSIYGKMIKRNKPFEEIYDLFAVRIILETDVVHECYTTFGMINEVYIPVPDRFKDYIAIPKNNNYQSIHTTVVGPEGLLVEVQIRTRKMHNIAEQGVAAHWKYKEGGSLNNRTIDSYVNWIREIIENPSVDDQKKNIIENFKMNLFSDEIYIFTPKGDLRRLPANATPVDFAFDIHSKVGHHCIGAKVNQRIVSLDTILHSGDQVDIITSKNQHPNKNWLKFVVTHKAKNEIRKWLNKEEDKIIVTGKEIWEKKLKKMKLTFTPQEIKKIISANKFENLRQFYLTIASGKVDLDEVLTPKDEEVENKEASHQAEIDKFTSYARATGGHIVIDGEMTKMLISYSKCCSPIPGDPVVGFVTVGEGIKIHRRNCKNLLQAIARDPEKVVDIQWPDIENNSFIAGLLLKGEDSPGLLNTISHTIVSYKNTNIKSINIDTQDNIFHGTVTLYVNNLQHLSSVIEKLKKIKGVYSVSRLEE